MLHRLIAKYFLPDGEKYYYDKNYVVNHKDRNKHNNKLDNLEWITNYENILHATAKKVAQIDPKTNTILKIHNCIRDAYRHIGIEKNSNIASVCNKKLGRKMAHAYKWEWVNPIKN